MKSGAKNPVVRNIGRDLPGIFLKQGEYYVSSREPAMVWTVLGSCVTVTMHCPVLKIGGITHSLLPYPFPGTSVPSGQSGRYVNSSVRLLLKKLICRGVSKSNLEVKVFGGGNLLPGKSSTPLNRLINIGRLNVETALMVIQELGLQVTATDVGGNHGRRLMFYPHRGDAWVKKVVPGMTRARALRPVTGIADGPPEKMALVG